MIICLFNTNIILVICKVWMDLNGVHHHLHLLPLNMIPIIVPQYNSPDSSTKSIDKLAME